jgi:hypothetical protein
VILLHSSLFDAFPPCEMIILNFIIWCMWIVDFCEFDVGSNFCEFSHILASSRMQPLMATKSWLDPGWSRQAGSRLLYGWHTYL